MGWDDSTKKQALFCLSSHLTHRLLSARLVAGPSSHTKPSLPEHHDTLHCPSLQAEEASRLTPVADPFWTNLVGCVCKDKGAHTQYIEYTLDAAMLCTLILTTLLISPALHLGNASSRTSTRVLSRLNGRAPQPGVREMSPTSFRLYHPIFFFSNGCKICSAV